MAKDHLAERVRVIRGINKTFPVDSGDLELQLQIYEPDFDEFISLGRPILIDGECKEAQGGLAGIKKLMHGELKSVPSSRLLIASVVGAYELMQAGDERAKRFMDKLMIGKGVSERVATDAGPYGVVHYDGLGRGIYTTKCPPFGDLDEIWKGEAARTMQILTGLKDPDKLIEITTHYGRAKPILMPPDGLVRAVHLGYATRLSICFGYYPDGHNSIGRGISWDLVVKKDDYQKNRR